MEGPVQTESPVSSETLIQPGIYRRRRFTDPFKTQPASYTPSNLNPKATNLLNALSNHNNDTTTSAENEDGMAASSKMMDDNTAVTGATAATAPENHAGVSLRPRNELFVRLPLPCLDRLNIHTEAPAVLSRGQMSPKSPKSPRFPVTRSLSFTMNSRRKSIHAMPLQS